MHANRECVEMLRKFLLTAGLVIFRNGSTLQLMLGVFVSVVYLAGFLHYKPMKEGMDYRLQTIASVQLTLTLAMGLAVRADTEARSNPGSDGNLTMNESVMAALLIVINVSVFAFALFALVQELRGAGSEDAGAKPGAKKKVAPTTRHSRDITTASGPKKDALISSLKAENASLKAEVASVNASLQKYKQNKKRKGTKNRISLKKNKKKNASSGGREQASELAAAEV